MLRRMLLVLAAVLFMGLGGGFTVVAADAPADALPAAQSVVDSACGRAKSAAHDGSAEVAQACCKRCSKGCPCGNSCISCSKTCRQPPGCACRGDGSLPDLDQRT